MLPFLGDICNPSDNIIDLMDSAFFNFTVTVPSDSSGNSFFVSAVLTFNNTEEIVGLNALTQECFIVIPTILASTDVSKT